MGIVPGTFNNSTCTRLLLWFAPLPSPLLLEDTLVLADMLPTLLESSMLPRGPLMPRPMPTMVLTALDMAMVVSMEDMDTVPMVPTLMPMVPTMARGLLMLSLRLMPTMVLTVLDMAMVVSMEDMDTVPMVPTPTPMVSTESRLLSALILIVLS